MVTPPLPLMTPPKLEPTPFGARVSAFAPMFTVPPAPASPPRLCAPAAERSKVPPAASVTRPFAASEPPLPSASVPALMVVPPVYVLAPLSVSVPLPCLTRPPVPPMVPA